MIKTPITMQDLRRKIYTKAKADVSWRFWGLYVHIGKMETLEEAYEIAKRNNGAAGLDRMTFDEIERNGKLPFLKGIQKELVNKTYRPTRNRKVEIPKGEGKTRTLKIPTIRDRVVQCATKLILEPIFEADFQDGSYGYRPNRDAHKALQRVKEAILMAKPYVIDVDIKGYFDNVGHDLLFKELAKRVNDADVMRLIKTICKSSGKRGIPQGGPLSPLLANIFLNGIDLMLEKAKETTKIGNYTNVEYARYADDIVILVGKHPRKDWLINGVQRRLEEELTKLDLQLNKDKTKVANLNNKEGFAFLGFDFRKTTTTSKKAGIRTTPKKQAKQKLMNTLRDIFRKYSSQPTQNLIRQINYVLAGWVNYFRIGNSTKCFVAIKYWVERKVRRHIARAKKIKGCGWKIWSSKLIYDTLGLYNDYKIQYYQPTKVYQPWTVT